MKVLNVFVTVFLSCTFLKAQIFLTASDSIGSAYEDVYAAGLDLENPDCVHTDFGSHITRSYDNLLERNVFDFHSHILEDNDRCQVFDRVRMEIKGGPNTNPESQHLEGSESYYRWKFKIPSDFKGSSSFCHLFQNKIKGGSDSSFPAITITPRTERLEIIHNGGDSGDNLGKVVNVDLAPFLGTWIEAYVYQKHGENGKIEITLKNLQSGEILVSYTNDDIDLWRPGAEYSRPKWGIYRKKVDALKDEIIQFADFCISETSSDLCPPDSIVIVDNEPPSAPGNLRVENIQISDASLAWDQAVDNFGVHSYILYQDGDSIWSGNTLSTLVENLIGGTNYLFSVKAVDAAGNISPSSNDLALTTDPVNSLPDLASNPFPKDSSVNISSNVVLNWSNGNNTDSSYIYLGKVGEELALVSRQVETSLSLELDPNTAYNWRVDQKNMNGVLAGDVWTFSTSSGQAEGAWLVYRANDRPDLETSFLQIRDIPENPTIDQVLPDEIVDGNNYYQFLEEGVDKFRWRYEFAEGDTAFTVVARIKGFEASNTITYFEVRLGGVRDKLRINHNTFKLEKSTPVVEKAYPFDFDEDYHLVRVTMKDSIMKVYLDENPIPFATGFSRESDAGSNFEFGKSGGPPAGCFVDWIAILPNQEIGPGVDNTIPQDLILSNDASISEILLDDVRLDEFKSSEYEYDIELENDSLPSIVVRTSSRFASYEIEEFESNDSLSYKIRVLAHDGVSSRIYTLNFLRTSLTDEVAFTDLAKIYPNPSEGMFTVSLKDGGKGKLRLFDYSGRLIFEQRINEYYEFKDKLKAGLYIVRVYLDSKEEAVTKIIIK